MDRPQQPQLLLLLVQLAPGLDPLSLALCPLFHGRSQSEFGELQGLGRLHVPGVRGLPPVVGDHPGQVHRAGVGDRGGRGRILIGRLQPEAPGAVELPVV